MKWLKYPMANAFYMAAITAVYATIFIVSSEFISNYNILLSNSWWALFISSKNMKFVGIAMIGIAVIIDMFSVMRRKKFDEYQILALEQIMIFNGVFMAILFPLSVFVLIFAPMCFAETVFALILLQWAIIVITETAYMFKNYASR